MQQATREEGQRSTWGGALMAGLRSGSGKQAERGKLGVVVNRPCPSLGVSGAELVTE